MFKHILVPTDGSRAALKAAKAAVRLAAALGARITAFHAIDGPHPAVVSGPYAADSRTFVNYEKVARAAGEELVAAVGKLAKAAGVPFASLVTKARTPYEGIVDAARKNKCDVIVIASRGRRGLERLLVGSVTQKVLAHATVPVIVYR
ncbi:MAG TPA: universal stress protein [Burkholderiales bacterium]